METSDAVRRGAKPPTFWFTAGVVVWALIFGAIVWIIVMRFGTVPSTILVPLAIVNILVIVGLVMWLRRATIKQAQAETPDEKTKRLLQAKRNLRRGVALYAFILLWDLYLVVKGPVSIPGVVLGVSINLLILFALISAVRKINRKMLDNSPSPQQEA